MTQEIKILINSQSRKQCDSLSGLLSTLPGVVILRSGGYASEDAPDILLLVGSPTDPESTSALHRARLDWPSLKTVLLVDSTLPGMGARSPGVDMLLPLGSTAGDLLRAIGQLAERKIQASGVLSTIPMVAIN